MNSREFLPFGRPRLVVAPWTPEEDTALAKVLDDVFRNQPLRHHRDRIVVGASGMGHLREKLDSLSQQEVFNTIVAVLDGGCRDLLEGYGPAILEFPEVHWLLLGRSPDDEEPLLSRHFAETNGPAIQSVLHAHAWGYRPCFDPSGLRTHASQAIRKLMSGSARQGHAAPYLAQALASSLLTRARRYARTSQTPQDCAHTALLALEAWRLLEGRTVGLALEALELAERMEAAMECAFVGASAQLPVKRRLLEAEALVECLPAIREIDPHSAAGKAVCVDEEETYLLLNGYVLFRHGYRVALVGSQNEMQTLLGWKNPKSDETSPKPLFCPDVSIEDVDLRFPDSVPDNQRHQASGESLPADNACSIREDSQVSRRLMVSDRSGSPTTASQALDVEDLVRLFLRREEDHPGLAKTRRIPVTTFSAVSKQLGVPFVAKPHDGCLGEISEMLGQRDPRWGKAVGMPPKTTERSWFARLFQDLAWWVGLVKRSNRIPHFQQASACVAITDEVRKVYQTYAQFEEEEMALRFVRRHRRRVWAASLKGWRRLALLVVPARWYVETMVGSGLALLAAVLGWIAALAIPYQLYCEPSRSYWECLRPVVLTFLEIQPPTNAWPEQSGFPWWFLAITLLVAYLHFGLLVSVLFKRASRR